MAVGLVAVVANVEDMTHVKEGMVVVSEAASPALAMVMSRLCGLATERGGQGAIASGFARAHGIPAVVGIEGLLRIVRDGDLMRVDGTKGIVEIVRRNAVRLTGRSASATGAGREKDACSRPESACLPAMQLRLENHAPQAGDR
jgi:phosphoenolpyruvate synthase/pyruvate phosphate dikinase